MIARSGERIGRPARWAWLAVSALLLLSACSANPLSRKYEYEEETYVNLDGSATVYVNAAVPALVALRGVDLALDGRAPHHSNHVRAILETPVHVRVEVADIRRLSEAGPFAWSTYGLSVANDAAEYTQLVGASAGRAVPDVGWSGRELVAFRLHLPSRITFHNSPSREVRRGNIIIWEQPLVERQRGTPIDITVRMDSDSILANTLLLFGAMIVLVIITFIGFVWFIRSRGRAEPSA